MGVRSSGGTSLGSPRNAVAGLGPKRAIIMTYTFPLLDNIKKRSVESSDALAIFDKPHRLRISYGQLYKDVITLSSSLLHFRKVDDLRESRVLILANKGYLIPLALLAVWSAGGIALPVLPSQPLPEHAYQLENAGAELILTDAANRSRAEDLQASAEQKGLTVEIVELKIPEEHNTFPMTLSAIGEDRRALMLYTSGTTGKPKGVVTRHSALVCQVESICTAWRWTSSDHLLHVLPLNHLHGIVVALLTTLWAGAAVELWEKFDGPAIWQRWINDNTEEDVTMFFGVPTVYSRLIAAHASLDADRQRQATAASAKLRLQVSGSAPLPQAIKKAWEVDPGIGGGQVLLERYGMTETGIIAGGGWDDADRIKGHVGKPLLGVRLRLWDEEHDVEVEGEDIPGEVQVSGPGIFQEYWNLPEVTAKEFTQDGWFKTGDIAILASHSSEGRGQYKILGRNSADIIKSGGEKLSAIEIESAILELPGMKDCAVVGIPDKEWGQVVGVCLVTDRQETTVDSLRTALRPILANYKLPRRVQLFDEIPRNAMGKVQKKALVVQAFP